ncbi:GAF domain-containing protein [Roseibium sp.]|uniref:GAF domain-containing protein n=1 Tax=Roseibium sp. TaxID=1936156 RepID=UPI003A985921
MQSVNVTRSHVDLVVQTVQDSAQAATSSLAASWRRSMMYHGLDPATPPQRPERVEASKLEEVQERNHSVLQVAAPVLERLVRSAGKVGCCAILSDESGLIIESQAAPAESREFDRWGLSKGFTWSEALAGTNGIGTCLVEKRAMIIHQDQHFFTSNTRLSCMSAPVFGAFGELVAALDLSSCRDDMTYAMSLVLSTVVIDSAHAIETELFRQAFPNCRIQMAEGHGASGVALLAVDDNDLVLGATRLARKSLGICDDVLARLPSLAEIQRREEPPQITGTKGGPNDIRRALLRRRGNVSAAARDLGISRATMYRRMKQYGIADPDC